MGQALWVTHAWFRDRLAGIRDRGQAPAFVTIPNSASGISGMTALNEIRWN
jgi:hypothetical protein